MRTFSAYTWKTSQELYESSMGNLIESQLSAKRVCIPGAPFNLGVRPLASGCDHDWECAPLSAAALAQVSVCSKLAALARDTCRSWPNALLAHFSLVNGLVCARVRSYPKGRIIKSTAIHARKWIGLGT